MILDTECQDIQPTTAFRRRRWCLVTVTLCNTDCVTVLAWVCRLVLQDSQGSAHLLELEQSQSTPLPLDLTDQLVIHWQSHHPLHQLSSLSPLAGKLQALDLATKQDQPLTVPRARAFGDQLIPAKQSPQAQSARLSAQTRTNPLMEVSRDPQSGQSETGSGPDVAQSSQGDAWLLLAANGQDPVQLHAYSHVTIWGPELRLVAAQEGPGGQTAVAFVEDSAIFRSPEGALSAVPLQACLACSQVRCPRVV